MNSSDYLYVGEKGLAPFKEECPLENVVLNKERDQMDLQICTISPQKRSLRDACHTSDRY